MDDRVVLDGGLTTQEDIQRVIDKLSAVKSFDPTRAETQEATEKEEAKRPAEQVVAGVSFMITREQREKLAPNEI
jgi:hypothetical protein